MIHVNFNHKFLVLRLSKFVQLSFNWESSIKAFEILNFGIVHSQAFTIYNAKS